MTNQLVISSVDLPNFIAKVNAMTAHSPGNRYPVAPSKMPATELAPERRSPLPLSLPPRGLSREQAAAYFGIGSSLFDRLVKDGRAPKPKQIDGRVVWDRLQLDRAFSALPDVAGHAEEDDRWDCVA
jgi:predicted DNA-binding transcriptional regulator AlpA